MNDVRSRLISMKIIEESLIVMMEISHIRGGQRIVSFFLVPFLVIDMRRPTMDIQFNSGHCRCFAQLDEVKRIISMRSTRGKNAFVFIGETLRVREEKWRKQSSMAV